MNLTKPSTPYQVSILNNRSGQPRWTKVGVGSDKKSAVAFASIFSNAGAITKVQPLPGTPPKKTPRKP